MQRISTSTAIKRAFHLKCPRCGAGRLFRGWFQMEKHCSSCRLKFERAPGYFLGSIYVNYGFLCLTVTPAYIWLHFGLGFSNEVLTGPLLLYIVITGCLLFHYARAWWLAMDCQFDTTDFSVPGTSRFDVDPTTGLPEQEQSPG